MQQFGVITKNAHTDGQRMRSQVGSLPGGSLGIPQPPGSSMHASGLPHPHWCGGSWRVLPGYNGSSHFWMRVPCQASPDSCRSSSFVEVRSNRLGAWSTVSPSSLGVHFHQ